MREIALMKKMDHPNVIKLHEVIFDEEKGKLYLVLEYADRGQLIEWDEENGRFFFPDERKEQYLHEEELITIFQDCVLGLAYRKKF
jgi:[calcium/calmodulin-dependent protein kinase] kinase